MNHRACNDAARSDWQKSTFSGASGCVEIRNDGTDVLVRDSKNPEQAFLRFTPVEWTAFLNGSKAGEFDHFVR